MLSVFPTELAKRHNEYRRVLRMGVLDVSRCLTQKKLMECCERAARRTGLLSGRTPSSAELRLLFNEVSEAVSFSPGQPLVKLSSVARVDLLQQTLETFAVFSEEEPVIIRWLLAHEPDHKLHGIGQLLHTWRAFCIKKKITDRLSINTAILQLIEKGDLPFELTTGIHFRSVRWFNPFEERVVAAFKKRLGPERVQVFSVLPAAHAETAEDRLASAVRSELMHGAEEEWAPWLEDFADAFEVDDSNILNSESRERVSFLVSANPYGEIEDAARRIARQIENGTRPKNIALILRNLGPYTDILPSVFQRFGIPYTFRRGTPALAHPPVKTLLALLAFSQIHSRDRLCDLLLMPGLQWPGLDVEARNMLAQKIRRNEPSRLHRLPEELHEFFRELHITKTPVQFAKYIRTLVERHGIKLPEEAQKLVDEVGSIKAQPMSQNRLTRWFEELLNHVTFRDDHCVKNGVYVINPMDAVGLRFDTVIIAAMDDRTFPKIPKTHSLLTVSEREALKHFLTEQKIHCPQLTLSETKEALIQEEILFMISISAARERLILSYARMDTDGKECAPGEFFGRIRDLIGTGNLELGESFHTILPLEHCRSEDEIRQTVARYSPNQERPMNFPSEKVRPLISHWLKTHPEFSATALETLALNRYVFFIEKILGIKPDRTHEDEPDRMERGGLLHHILEQIYTAVTMQSEIYAKKGSNGWNLSQKATAETIPLALLNPAHKNDLLALAREIAQKEFAKAERLPNHHLGQRNIWETEKRKLLQIIENFIRVDLETAQSQNRYPALFEMAFDQKHDLPVTLKHDGKSIQIKGKIDRIDLLFDDNGNLSNLLVIDYKSKSSNHPVSTLEKKIAKNFDCQLPLYTFAAQQKFFDAHNTPELNKKTQAVYHLQECNLKKMTNHFEKKQLTMTSELSDAFLETLFSNVWKLRAGDLATAPLIARYEDYSHICRTTAIDIRAIISQ